VNVASYRVKEGDIIAVRDKSRQLAIIAEARRLGFHSLIARVAEGSGESLHINESVGFTRVGVLKEVGKKFGQRLGVHLLQLILD